MDQAEHAAESSGNEPEDCLLGSSAKELLAKLRFIENDDPAKVLDRFYGILGILDSKASGLMGANGIFIAIVTFLLGPSISGDAAKPVGYFGFTLAAFDLGLFAVSSILCLLIVRINWAFLSKVKAKNGSYDFASEEPHLARETLRRTRFYQSAWHLTLLGFLILAYLASAKGG